MPNTLQRRQFTLLAFVFQTIFILLFAIFCRYDEKAMPYGRSSRIYVNTDYPLFQDIHRYGFSAISINLLLTAFVIQYTVLLRGFLTHDFVTTGRFTISVNE
ncbi:RHR-2 protein [Aphelenchoides avenae]|nr:RHR-2 protein [Aphelenchus avenae]